MKLYTAAFVVILIAATYPTHATAEEYDYDIGVSYRNSNSDLETPLAFIGGDSFGTSTISNDSDALELSGTWYYSGLSDSVGPKSSLSLAFSYMDESRFISSTGLTSPPLPPGLPTRPPSSGSLGNDTSGKLKADLRHVWQSSGWYGLAGVDRNAHYVGVGKYLGDTTALDFRVPEDE